mmetsp:Transcript_27568/g.72809  ORF Transcript_27568/g.72809 Transcript_27568/m.72809 type:complete len:203 (+) Transcript_27568:21-629(+)
MRSGSEAWWARCTALRAETSLAWLAWASLRPLTSAECWSAESPISFSTYCRRSATVACLTAAWFASEVCLDSVSTCFWWAALRSSISRVCRSAESPSSFSRYSMRSGRVAWCCMKLRLLAPEETSLTCRSWASLTAWSSLACLSAESPSARSRYCNRSAVVAWCACCAFTDSRSRACLAWLSFMVRSSAACRSAESWRSLSR